MPPASYVPLRCQRVMLSFPFPLAVTHLHPQPFYFHPSQFPSHPGGTLPKSETEAKHLASLDPYLITSLLPYLILPLTPLESHPYDARAAKVHRITSLQEKGGGRGSTSHHPERLSWHSHSWLCSCDRATQTAHSRSRTTGPAKIRCRRCLSPFHSYTLFLLHLARLHRFAAPHIQSISVREPCV